MAATGLLTAALAAAGIVTYRGVKLGSTGPYPLPAPIPADYISVIGVYGLLGLIPGEAAGVAGAIGWGLVVAMLLGLWGSNPGQVATAGTEAAGPAVTTTAKKGS